MSDDHAQNPNTVDGGVFSKRFAAFMLFAEIVIIILYGTCTKYSSDASTALGGVADQTVLLHYGKFQDVHVMIFMGFGFLMTFLKKYGFSSVGFNFLISAFTIQVAMLSNGLWHQLLASGTPMEFHAIEIDITTLITGDFAAGAVMITFGAVLGKASPLELAVVVVAEMMFYGCNENIGAIQLRAVDMGGSIFVHTFGAYFGLALSWVITPKEKFEEDDEGSCYHSDMFAMIGTIFLWMFWPSFNGALATGTQQHRVIINTVLALTASCIMSFVMSALMRHQNKFDMVDIQNATLAGGVAVGSSSDLTIDPWGAILVGCVAGAVSVLGYTVLQPWLQHPDRRIVHDTCGVHNLHGMPGLIGGIGGAITAATTGDTVFGEHISTIYAARGAIGEARSAGEQGGYQMAALTITLCISIGGGIITGFIVKAMRSMDGGHKNYYHDADYWEGVEDLDGAPDTLKVGAPEAAAATTVHADSTAPGAAAVTIAMENKNASKKEGADRGMTADPGGTNGGESGATQAGASEAGATTDATGS